MTNGSDNPLTKMGDLLGIVYHLQLIKPHNIVIQFQDVSGNIHDATRRHLGFNQSNEFNVNHVVYGGVF